MYLEKYIDIYKKASEIEEPSIDKARRMKVITDCGIKFVDYFSARVDHELKGGPVYVDSLGLSHEDRIDFLESLERNRSIAHNSAMMSFFILNRQANNLGIEPFYDGPLLDPKNLKGDRDARQVMTDALFTFLHELNQYKGVEIADVAKKLKDILEKNPNLVIPNDDEGSVKRVADLNITLSSKNDADIIRYFRNNDVGDNDGVFGGDSVDEYLRTTRLSKKQKEPSSTDEI